jgi:hypothetical protein
MQPEWSVLDGSSGVWSGPVSGYDKPMNRATSWGGERGFFNEDKAPGQYGNTYLKPEFPTHFTR